MTLSDQDFRRDKRVSFTLRAPLATDTTTGRPIEEASTIDLSGSGLRVRLSGPISPGQIVEVFLNKRPERCRVVWTTAARTNKEFIVGLEFVSPLPNSEPTPPSDAEPNPTA
jgi:hypothetical protein